MLFLGRSQGRGWKGSPGLPTREEVLILGEGAYWEGGCDAPGGSHSLVARGKALKAQRVLSVSGSY